MRIATKNRVWCDRRTCSPTLVSLLMTLLLSASGCAAVRGTEPSPGASTEPVNETDEAQQLLVRKGRSQFLHCNSCHVIDSTAPPPFGGSVGPHLEDIVGRASGSVEGFEYTEAFLALDLVWDEEALDQWLQQPQALLPALCEPFTGMARPEHRKALIAYLKNPGN